MNGMNKILALCDMEEEYAYLMTEYMKKQKDLPWEVRTYTSLEELLRTEQGSFVLMVVSESLYCAELESLKPLKIIVLNESGLMRWEDMTYVDKYQPAEEVLRTLLQIFLEVTDTPLPRLGRNCHSVFIGHYSPVHRSMQTSIALAMGQLLAREHSVLYLNFEPCAGIGELLPTMQTLDMADLMYFLDTDKEKFRIRLQTICRHMGSLDYVPPMKSGQNLLSIAPLEWMKLLQRIEELGEYEFVILDLSECIQGLFSIMRQCKRIFTLTKDDKIAQSKLMQYEQLLAMYDYEDVLDRSKRLEAPQIHRFPEEPEQVTKGEIAVLVKDLLEEL